MLYFLYDTLHGRWSNHSSQPPSWATSSFWPLYVDQRSLCMIYKPKTPLMQEDTSLGGRTVNETNHREMGSVHKFRSQRFTSQTKIGRYWIGTSCIPCGLYTLAMRADFFGYPKALMNVWDHKNKLISTTRQYVQNPHKAACESQMLPAWNSPKGAQKDFILTPSQTTLM
jgi:hypothetical protein